MQSYCTKCKKIVRHKVVAKGYKCVTCQRLLTIDAIRRESERE
jgi:DNA-directed RNA polymerase subunit RPC12/RpoP